MTTKSTRTVRNLSCRESRAVFLSLFICHCCYYSTSVSALQVQTRHPRSLFPSQSLLLSEIHATITTTTTTKESKKRSQRSVSLSSSLNSQEHTFQDDTHGMGSSHGNGINRRQVFSNSAKALFAGIATPFLLDPTDPANALLLRFPINAPNTQPLKNKYHFLRAGASELEVEGIYSTNPLFLTNRENGLSPQGYDCLKVAADMLNKSPLSPTVAYHSLAANGMDTGDFLARELKLGRDRLLPEFTYLDQRGIGLWDSSEESQVRHAVWAMDALEAGSEGFGGRPPANTDGTPNDTLHDQFTRLRQFISLQETRTSGDIILVIFPDGTGPALLSCMMAGIPYKDVHALEYKPGELRLDITPESIREMYEIRKKDPAYLEIIEEGTQKLKELRQMNAAEFSVSFKDSQSVQKEEEENWAFYEKQKAATAEKQKVDEERRSAIQEQMRVSKQVAQEKQDQRLRDELAVKAHKEQNMREVKERAEKRKVEQQSAYVAQKQKQAEATAVAKQKQVEAHAAAQATKKQRLAEMQASAAISKSSESSLPFGLSPTVLATAAFGAIGAAVVVSETDDEDEINNYSAVITKKDNSGDDDITAAETTSISAAVQEENSKIRTTAPVTIDKEEERNSYSPMIAKKDDSDDDVAAETTTMYVAAHEENPETQTTAPFTIDKKEERNNDSPVIAKKDDSDIDDNAAVERTTISAAAQEENPLTQTTAPVTSDKHLHCVPATTASSLPSPSTEIQVENNEIQVVVNITSIDPKEDESVNSSNVVHVSFKTDDNGNNNEKYALTSTPNNDRDLEDEFTTKLQAAEQEMKDAFVEAADVKKKKQQQHQHQKSLGKPQSPKQKSSLFDNDLPVIVTKKITKTSNFIYDDDEDDSDWLRVLSEIRDEAGDEDDKNDIGMADYTNLVNDV